MGCGTDSAPASSSQPGAPGAKKAAAPVEVAALEIAPITMRRTFSGTLEAATRVQIAARVGGRISRIAVDLGDEIERGQLIAEIDAAELDAAVLQAAADLAVAKATVTEAKTSADFSARTLERLELLDKEGIASASEIDAARAQSTARQASVAVAEARVQRAEAALGVAQTQLSETRVLASWSGEDLSPAPGTPELAETVRPPGVRAVAERYVDEGELVSAGTPLALIVGLQPIVAVVFVPERDYGKVQLGAVASLVTDAYPDKAFDAVVSRVAPVFSRTTRQVRVELTVDNQELRLKPGMFVRTTLELDQNDQAAVIPYAAITRRDGMDGVFVLTGPDGLSVRWLPIRQGIREGDRVEIEGAPGHTTPSPGARIVTLGQELCDDGSQVVVPDDAAQATR
jgi:multidrug efflux pump subunit AcrA (membrane-fusion protein)